MMTICELEKLRIKARNGLVISSTFVVLLLVSNIFLNVNTIFIVMSVVILIVILFINNKHTTEYKKQFKNYFVKSSLSKILDNLEFNSDAGFSESLVKSIGILRTSDTFSSNDYVKGSYKNVNLEFADLEMKERRSSGKSSHYVTVFKGSFMIFEFNKNFKSNVRVWEKSYKRIGDVGFFRANKYVDVQLEDALFNKEFNVEAINELDAFYIITPHMIEKIKSLTNSNNGSMAFGFIDNKLYISNDNNKDNFEPNLFKKINEEEIHKIVNSQIVGITQFIEELDLDNKIFK